MLDNCCLVATTFSFSLITIGPKRSSQDKVTRMQSDRRERLSIVLLDLGHGRKLQKRHARYLACAHHP